LGFWHGSHIAPPNDDEITLEVLIPEIECYARIRGR
jgi:hypothetical protein